MTDQTVEQLCVNTIRTLAIDGVQKANSGHPGMPMGMADGAFVIWTQFLRHNPRNPHWFNRDRFVLSPGHGSMLLYSLLHLTGYDVSLDDLKSFRQWGSITPGHPEVGLTPGVETTTGPLGQGFANGVGFAIAEAFLAATFNRAGHDIIDHYTYGIVSDGDLMEGVSHEAASLAGHLKLGKLIYLYDDNHISIDGSTDLAFTEDRMARFRAYGWHVQSVDGHDRAAIAEAIVAAQAVTDQPSIIACRTHIGYGSPNKQDTSGVHGSPLGAEEIKLTKAAYGWQWDEPFTVPDAARDFFRQAVAQGAEVEAAWLDRFAAYEAAFPAESTVLKRAIAGELPAGWAEALPVFNPADGGMATRAASGKVLNAIAPYIPNLIGGSADLAPSNNTFLKDYPAFSAENYSGRNFHFGVREHGMSAIINGMALHGGIIPYGGTFLVFADYSRPALRVAALSHVHAIFVFTHDSIGLGEDGPTHQPVEHLAALRAIPNFTLIRPADANETAQAWRVALEHKSGPVVLALTRQKVPTFDPAPIAVEKGAYILRDAPSGSPDVILIATGSEVGLAMDAADALAQEGIGARVVSMPSWELFAAQPRAYRDTVLPPEISARVAVEAGVTFGWERWVGERGRIIGLDRFGASAPASVLFEQFGFTVDNVVAQAKAVLG